MHILTHRMNELSVFLSVSDAQTLKWRLMGYKVILEASLLKAPLALVLETGLDQRWQQACPGWHPVEMTSPFLVYDALLMDRWG